MPSRLKLLVAFSLLLLVSANPRPVSEAPIVTPSSTPVQSWEPMRRLLDEEAYRTAVWYAEASKPALKPTTIRVRSAGSGSHRGYATAKECVSMVEHGGSYDRSSNPSHFGRYQFSRGTWAAYGGNPETWGNASPAEQDAVFERAWNSPGGPNNWLPYDGCG